MTTFTQFTPSANTNFSWTPTLDGQQYSAVIVWSLFGQRWVLNIYSLSGALVLMKPLTGSPDNYDINLVQGYFAASSLVYRVSRNSIEVTP